MSKIGVMVCGHGSRDLEAITEFQSVAAGIARRAAAISRGPRLPRIRPPDHPRRARQAARGRACEHILAVPGMLFAAGHVKNDIPSVLNDLCGAASAISAIDYGRDLAVGPKAAARRAPSASSRPKRAATTPGAARGDAADGGRPRHLRSRRQFQHHQGRAHALGGHGLRLGGGLLQRRHLPAGRARPRACGEARLPPHHRVPLFPVHRRAGEAHLSHRRPDGRAPSGDRVPEGRLSQRPSAGARRLRRAGRRRSWTARTR